MATAQDYVDTFWPEAAPQQPVNPYDQMLMDYLQRTGIGMDDPMVQQMIAMSPAKYQAANAQKQVENERDYQTGRDKYALDVMQASQGAQMDQQRQALDQREFDQKYGDTGQMAESMFASMNPADVQKAFSGDWQAYHDLGLKIAEMTGEATDGVPFVGPRTTGIMAIMAQDDRVFSPEQQVVLQREQDQAEQMGGDLATFNAQLNPTMKGAVRETVMNAQNPDATLQMFAANKGDRNAANAAAGMSWLSSLYGPQGGQGQKRQGKVGHGMPNRGVQAQQAMKAEQAKVWNAGPALNRSPEPVVQATQTWNQPGVVNPNMTPAQAFELLHSPEAALAASPNRPAPPKAKDKPKPKPKPADKKKPPAQTSTPPSRYSGAK